MKYAERFPRQWWISNIPKKSKILRVSKIFVHHAIHHQKRDQLVKVLNQSLWLLEIPGILLFLNSLKFISLFYSAADSVSLSSPNASDSLEYALFSVPASTP